MLGLHYFVDRTDSEKRQYRFLKPLLSNQSNFLLLMFDKNI
ncbi:MAG: hypothetical protein ACI9Q3_001443 [Maribacter sp.]|jgi:hypothetical protein